MVDFVTDTAKLEGDVVAFAYTAASPELRTKLTVNMPGVQADRIIGMKETLYAHYDELDDAGKRAMAQIFEYERHMWPGGAERAGKIADHTSADLGERGAIKPPQPEDWPEPKTELRAGWDWRYEDGAKPTPESEAPPVPLPEEAPSDEPGE